MSAFAWPACICAAALIGLFMFRKEISRLIDRTRSVTKDGIVTDAIAKQEVKNIVRPSAADALLKEFDNQLLIEQEKQITTFLDQQNVHTSDEREKVLVRYLASAYTTIRFESVYHTMWGSQFRALEMLNQSRPQGVPLQALEGWYELGKAGHPAWYTNYSFEQWIGYLKGMALIVVGNDGLVHITLFGNEFLKYLVQSGYDTLGKGG